MSRSFRVAGWLVGLGMVVAGCVSPASPTCGDRVCAVGQVCSPGGDRCATPAQIDACAGLNENDACTFGSISGTCRGSVCATYACGNGVVEVGEICDDGNVRSGDGCSADCASNETCGNGIRDNAEACDDGNTISGDGCQDNCSLPSCGDGTVDSGEICDDGNNINSDGCNAACTSNETCQNGVVDPQKGEECDDGNAIASDGCQPNCKVPRCGDNYIDPGEICDNGNTVSGDGCSADCKSKEVCGNGYVDFGEQCDGGSTSTPDGVGVNTPTCNADCTVARCGDGKPNAAAGETCDVPTDFSICDPDCTAVLCGDGLANVAAGEQCDLGISNSNSPNSLCRLNCMREQCGDGILDPNDGEDCDGSVPAGFTCQDFGFYDTTTLGCSSSCNFDTSLCDGYCGDRELRSGTELCEGKAPPNESCLDYGFDSGAIGCRSACTPDLTACKPAASWSDMPAKPIGWTNGLWGTSSTNVIAVARSGQIARWDGSAWSTMTSGTTQDLYGVWGSGASDIFAVGLGGTILHYNGSWSTMTSGTTADLYAVWGTAFNDVYAVGGNFSGGFTTAVFHYNGVSWSPFTLPVTTVPILSVWGAQGKVFFAGESDSIFIWNGASWQTTPTNSGEVQFRSVWGSSSSNVFAVGYGGIIVRYNGSTWSTMTSGIGDYLYGIWGTNANDVFAVGDNGTSLHWNGSQWSTMPTGTTLNFAAVWGANGEVFAIGLAPAKHLKLAPTWLSNSPGTPWMDAVWGTGANNVYAGGNYCYLRQWDGATWNAVPVTNCCPGGSCATSFYGIWGTSSSDYFVVGSGQPTGNTGSIWHWSSNAWSGPVDVAQPLHAVWGAGSNDVYAVGNVGLILHYTGTWTPVAVGLTSASVEGVWGSGTSDVFAATLGGILHWNGASWSAMTGVSGQYYGVWGSGPKDVFAVGAGGVIRHYNGTTWSAMDSGTSANLRAISGVTSSDVYAVGDGGVIVHFDGVRWTRQTSGTASGLFDVWAGQEAFAVGHAGVSLRYRRFCSASETSCGDGEDEDCDGYTDCDDSDCSANATCAVGGVCAGWQAIGCNVNLTDTTVGGPSSINAYGCDSWLESGRERVYRVVPGSTTNITATLTGMTKDLDLIVTNTGAGGGCQTTLGGCLGASSKGIKSCSGGTNAGASCSVDGDCQSGSCLATLPYPPETVTFTAQAGQPYYIIVDGYGSNAGGFTLDVSCP